MRSAQLHNSGLEYTCPSVPSPTSGKDAQPEPGAEPPAFWKHTGQNQAYLTGRLDSWVPSVETKPRPNSFAAPAGAHKLLSADYDFLEDPGAPGGAGTIKSTWAELPDPPLALKQTRYFVRARTTLVKLQTQVRQCVETALAEGGCNLQQQQQGFIPPQTPADNSKTNPTTISTNTVAAAAPGAGWLATLSASPQYTYEEITESVRNKLAAMFDDCMDDLMDQLWTAMQHSGTAHSKVAVLQQAMMKRDEVVEAHAQQRAVALEAQVQALKAQVAKAQEQAHAERLQSQAAALATASNAEHLAKVTTRLQSISAERDALKVQLEAQVARQAAAMKAKDLEHEEAMKHMVQRVEETTRQHQQVLDRLQLKDAELAAAHTRLGEQLSMLELAFNRRDQEVKRGDRLSRTLNEYTTFVAHAGSMSALEWIEELETGAAEGALVKGELREGPAGFAKALLLSAKNQGLSLMIEATKSALPQNLPKYVPQHTNKEELPESPRAPRVTRIAEEYVPGLLPQHWLRLLSAPLAEQMAPKTLCRHINALYAEKEAADQACLAAGNPVQSLHDVIFNTYLRQYQSTEGAVHAVISLTQSVRSHEDASIRIKTFGQFLGLIVPGLPETALNVYLSYRRALLAPATPVALHCEDEEGAVMWVHPSRWRLVLCGPLSRHADGATLKSILKLSVDLKLQQARSQPSFGMNDFDDLMGLVMDGWLSFTQEITPASLKQLFERHCNYGQGVYTVEQFNALLGAISPSAAADEQRVLQLLHACIATTAVEMRDVAIMKGCIAADAFVKVCIQHGVTGALGLPPSTVEFNRLQAAVTLLQAAQEGVKKLLDDHQYKSLLADQIQTGLSNLQGRLAMTAAVGGSGGGPVEKGLSSSGTNPAILDAQSIADAWEQLAGMGSAMAEVHAEVASVVADRRRWAAEQAAARDAELRQKLAAAAEASEQLSQQLSEAVQAKEAAVQERDEAVQAAQAAQEAHAAQLQAVAAESSATHRMPRASESVSSPTRFGRPQHSLRPGLADDHPREQHLVDQDGEQWPTLSSLAAIRDMNSPRLSADARPVRSSTAGPEPGADRSRMEYERAVKRAEMAEVRIGHLQSQIAEQSAALQKQRKALKRKAGQQNSRMISGLLATLAKMLLQGLHSVQTISGTPAARLAHLMELVGRLEGLSLNMSDHIQRVRSPQLLAHGNKSSSGSSEALQSECTTPMSPDLIPLPRLPIPSRSLLAAVSKLPVTLSPRLPGDAHHPSSTGESPQALSPRQSRDAMKDAADDKLGEASQPRSPTLTPTKHVGLRLKMPSSGSCSEDDDDSVPSPFLKTQRAASPTSTAACSEMTSVRRARKVSSPMRSKSSHMPHRSTHSPSLFKARTLGSPSVRSKSGVLSHEPSLAMSRLWQESSTFGDMDGHELLLRAARGAKRPLERSFLTGAAHSLASSKSKDAASGTSHALIELLQDGMAAVMEAVQLLSVLHHEISQQRSVAHSTAAAAEHVETAGEVQTTHADACLTESKSVQCSILEDTLDLTTNPASAPPTPTGVSKGVGTRTSVQPDWQVTVGTQTEELEQGSDSALAAQLIQGLEHVHSSKELLGEAALAVIKACGNSFPGVMEDGSLFCPADGTVLVTSSMSPVLDPQYQAECLRQLYLYSAGLFAASCTKVQQLKALDTTMSNYVADVSAAASAAAELQQQSESLATVAGMLQQMKLLSSALSTIQRHANSCSQQVAHVRADRSASHQGSDPAQPVTLDSAVDLAGDQQPLPVELTQEQSSHSYGASSAGGTHASSVSQQAAGHVQAPARLLDGCLNTLQALQVDLQHANSILSQLQAMLGSAGCSKHAQDSTDAPTGSALHVLCGQKTLDAVSALASMLQAVPQGTMTCTAKDDTAVTACILPSQLFPWLSRDASTSCNLVSSQTDDQPYTAREQHAAWGPAQARSWLRDFGSPPAVPPASPTASSPGRVDGGLPPGLPVVLLDSRILQRSQHSPPRYHAPAQGARVQSGHPGRPSSAVPALDMRYDRRPYTARRYVEAVMFQGAVTHGSSKHLLWSRDEGAFWTNPPRHVGAHINARLPGQTSPGRTAPGTSSHDQAPIPILAGPWPWWHQALRGAAHQYPVVQHDYFASMQDDGTFIADMPQPSLPVGPLLDPGVPIQPMYSQYEALFQHSEVLPAHAPHSQGDAAVDVDATPGPASGLPPLLPALNEASPLPQPQAPAAVWKPLSIAASQVTQLPRLGRKAAPVAVPAPARLTPRAQPVPKKPQPAKPKQPQQPSQALAATEFTEVLTGWTSD